MKPKRWIWLLCIELVTVPLVIFLFKFFADQKRVAALIAGILFLAVGFYVLVQVWRSQKWRSCSFWMALVHLGGTAGPLFIYRLIYFQQDFTQVLIFGIPGPIFHFYSEKVYVFLLLASFTDLIFSYFKGRWQKQI